MADKNYNLPGANNQGLTRRQEQEIRELIASALANYTGVTRFRTIESVVTTIADFTSSQHNHANAAGGGQINPNTAFSAVAGVPVGGIGVNTLTGIAKGNGAGAFTAIVPLSGTGSFYASATSGGLVDVKFDYDSGIITART